MKRCARAFHAAALLLLATSIPAIARTSRELSFEQRVEAQRAIERVYISHLEGTRRTFDQAVTQELLERKVRTYLQQSALLESQWHTPITAAMLAAEGDRIARSTQFPERLAEIEAALGHDTFLIQETLVRASLAERLTRGFFAYDPVIHAAARTEAEGIQQQLAAGTLDPAAPHPRRIVEDTVEGVIPAGEAGGTAPRTTRMQQVEGESGDTPAMPGLAAGSSSPMPRPEELGIVMDEIGSFRVQALIPSDGESSLAVYTVPKVSWDTWWGMRRLERTGAAVAAVAGPWKGFIASRRAAGLSCHPDGWDNGLLDDVPDPRYGHSAIWTGTEMIAYGGRPFSGTAAGGHRYDPLTDTWRSISVIGAPILYGDVTAVWTGSEMIVWGGSGRSGRYNPASDTWQVMSAVGMPEYQDGHTAVWTGREMLIWGGHTIGGPVTEGKRYEPNSNTWTRMSVLQAPTSRRGHTALWTGKEMIVWGGRIDESYYAAGLSTGGRYDPASDSWNSTSAVNVPYGRWGHTAVWTGTEMIVWGGQQSTNVSLAHLGRYDPLRDSWSVGLDSLPGARKGHTAVWTGEHMVILGGVDAFGSLVPVGGRYDPLNDSWMMVPETNFRSIVGGTAVWTGSQVIFWGGGREIGLQTVPWWGAGRLDPLSLEWTPVRRAATGGIYVDAASPIVWTGTEMIAWSVGPDGGGPGVAGEGGRYDPTLDMWKGLTRSGAPEGRVLHATVWTGDEMMIWSGGYTTHSAFTPLKDGAWYDPVTDSWRTFSAPSTVRGRMEGIAYWTGQEVLFWGGYLEPVGLRYDPKSDSWAYMTQEGQPAFGSAAWTGHELIVVARTASARYEPQDDHWYKISAPPNSHYLDYVSPVWSGSQLIVASSYDASNGPDILVYDPAIDQWSTFDTPASRYTFGQSLIWTGKQAILYGGFEYPLPGFVYDHETKAFELISNVGAPTRRNGHSAVWANGAMLVWGGRANIEPTQASGGRFFYHAPCSPPTALAGPDVTHECASADGSSVRLDGSASTDPDNDIASYLWLSKAGTPDEAVLGSGASVDLTLPLGAHDVTLRVSDTAGATDEDTLRVSVVDTVAPSLNVTADPPILWPPNHRMVPVAVDAAVHDACDPSPTSYLVSLVSSEPDDAQGHDDGQTGGDAGEPGEGDVIPLRAERSGDGPGRLYTLTWKAKDDSGNETTATGGVFVPHDLHGVIEPIDVTATRDALEWTAVAGAISYNVLRAPLSGLTSVGSFTLVHDAVCAGRGVTSSRLAGPIMNETPAPGQIFGYLVESFDGRFSGYGTARGTREIVVASGDACQ